MMKKVYFIFFILAIAFSILFPFYLIHTLSPYYMKNNRIGGVWIGDDFLGFTAQKDAHQLWKRYFDRTNVKECTGSLGERLNENLPPVCEGRVFILGDSLVWAAGFNDHETFSYYLQEKLYSKNICVYNFGVSGYSFLQMYLRLKKEIAQLMRPGDVLIIALSLDSVLRDIYGAFGGAYLKPRYVLRDTGLEVKGLTNTNIFNKFPLIRRIGCKVLRNTKREQLKNLYLYLINDLINSCQKKGVSFKIILLPFERELLREKPPFVYSLIKENTPSEYLFDAFPLFAQYLEENGSFSLSPFFKVHYDSGVQQFLANIFFDLLKDDLQLDGGERLLSAQG